MLFSGAYSQLTGGSNPVYIQSRFNKTYGDADKDESGLFVREDANGNFYVVSRAERDAFGLIRDLMLVKYDQDGTTIWSKKIKVSNGTSSLSVSDMEVLDGGDLVLTINTGLNPAIAKIKASNGNLDWLKTIPGTNFSGFRDLEPISGGDFIVINKFGFTGSGGELWRGITVDRMDAFGNIIFSRQLATDITGTKNIELRPVDLDQVNDGRLVVAVEIPQQGGNPEAGHLLAFMVLKSNGSLDGAFTYDVPNQFDEFYPIGIMPVTDHAYAIFGNYRAFSTDPKAQIFSLIVTETGSIFEQGIYCNDANVSLRGHVEGIQSLEYVACGLMSGDGLIWRKSALSPPKPTLYDDGNNETFYSIDRAAGSRHVLTGLSEVPTDEQGLFIKTGLNGGTECDLDYTNTFSKCGNTIVSCGLSITRDLPITQNSIAPNYTLTIEDHQRPCAFSCFIPGEWIDGGGDDKEGAQRKQSVVPGLPGGNGSQAGSALAPAYNALLAPTLYPQPAKDKATLAFSEVTNQDLVAHLYDLQGRLVREFRLPAGSQNHQLNLDGLIAGHYLLSLDQASGQVLRMRLTIQR